MESPFVQSCQTCTDGNKVTVKFFDGTWTFHAQWLHDARCDGTASRNANTALCENKDLMQVAKAHLEGHFVTAELHVEWKNKTYSTFPAAWLRVMAPMVAQAASAAVQAEVPHQQGWTTETLRIPEISFHEIFVKGAKEKEEDEVRLRIMSLLLQDSAAGIVKITGLPKPDREKEIDHQSVVTDILKHVFGSVWQHPRRRPDTTFNVTSDPKNDEQRRAKDVDNYDTKQVLLPHQDHSFYHTPIQVMGFYCLEGKSENTWVSSLAALKTMKEEHPELYPYLCTAPMAIGRSTKFYGPDLRQATVDTPVTLEPGSKDIIKRFRWHQDLTQSLLAPYDDYKQARLAHVKMQEIMCRNSHQYKIPFEPGDLYIWNNFHMLHGRERTVAEPRTGIGQSVTEQVVTDRYRELLWERAKKVLDDKWLVHMPARQLEEVVRMAG